MDFRTALVGVLRVWADACRVEGFLAEALASHSEVLDMMTEIVRVNPTDESAIAVLAEQHSDVARTLSDQQRFPAALEHQRQSARNWTAAVDLTPDDLMYRRGAVRSQVGIAEYLWRANRIDEARQLLEPAIANLRADAASDPARALTKAVLGDALRLLARVLLSADGPRDVVALTAEAAALAAGLLELDPSAYAARVAAAECLLLDGRGAEARETLLNIIKQSPRYAPAHRLLLECPDPTAVDRLIALTTAAETHRACGYSNRSDFAARRASADAFTEVALEQQRRGDLDAAAKTFDRVTTILFDLQQDLPDTAGPRRDLAVGWFNQSQAQLAVGDVPAAATSMLQVSRYVDAEPSLREETRASLSTLADRLSASDPELSKKCTEGANKLGRSRRWRRK
ncbi:tetratricopeptide repeat protein (plasmid) [Mycolicibacterium aichiense]|uniref:tetratricopeptide repeat protein n=1 Tax=Mycolicibacterium aichiense TaxID=1799 RepID=UPI003D67EC22